MCVEQENKKEDMANNKSDGPSFVVNRKRKCKAMSEEKEELNKIFESDNPFKTASDLEESHIKKMKCAGDVKRMHRRMRLLYKNASSLINEQRKERFGTKLRVRAVRRNNVKTHEQNNINNSLLDIHFNGDSEYRIPCVVEADNLAYLFGRMSIFHLDQAPLQMTNGSVEQNVQEIANGLRNASLSCRESRRRGRVLEEDDNDERPALKKPRRSID